MYLPFDRSAYIYWD